MLQGFEVRNEFFEADVGFGERLKNVVPYGQEF